MATEPTPKPDAESKPPESTRDAISVTEEEDDHLVEQAAAQAGYDTRSHVVTEEPALQEAAAKPAESPKAPDESDDKAGDGEGDADDDESKPASADAGSSSESAAGDTDTDGEVDEQRPKSRRARKTARLQKELAEARERIATLERSAQAAPPTEPAKEPIADDFASWEEYAEAKAVFIAEKKVAEQSPPAGGAGTDGGGPPIPVSWGEISDKYSDFDEIAYASNLAVNQTMVNQLIDMNEEGAETLYYLGKHPDEAKRIATVTGETAVARELAKIAIKAVEAGKTTGNGSQPPTGEAANVAPTVSNAPPPIKPPEGGGAQGRQVDLDSASPDEYRRIRREQMAARG